MALGAIARAVLGHFGYVIWKREFLRYGVDPFLDIARLSRAYDREILTVFDVGANDGATLAAALPAFPDAEFHAFEPHPKTFARLQAAIDLPHAHLHQLGLGDRSGEVAFYEYGSEGAGSLMNSMVPDARFAVRSGYPARRITVPSSTVDTFCADRGIERIDVLKLDVEGFELAALHGARRMLAEDRIGFVYAEFNDLRPQDGATGGALLPLAEFLEGFGMRYVATYTDFILPHAGMHVCANVLFVRPPRA